MALFDRVEVSIRVVVEQSTRRSRVLYQLSGSSKRKGEPAAKHKAAPATKAEPAAKQKADGDAANSKRKAKKAKLAN